MKAVVRYLTDAILLVILTPILRWIWQKVAIKLGEDAVFGWINSQIASYFGIRPLEAAQIIDWIVPIALGIAVILAYHGVQRRWFYGPVAIGPQGSRMWPYWILLFACMGGAVFALSRLAEGPR